MAFLFSACDKTDRSFSLLSDQASFQQAPEVIQRKIDILWVVDNSGSMDSSQQNLVNSFGSFINRIQTLNFDFHMAVTATDAYRGNFYSSTNPVFTDWIKRFRKGPLYGSGSSYYYSPDSGVAIMDRNTPNLNQVFVTNATQGTFGSGDERAFSSFKDVLDPTFASNTGFRRPDAFLAIIIVSDEDDFSANTSTNVAGAYRGELDSDPVVLPAPTSPSDYPALYTDSRITPVSAYKTFLDGLVGAGNYSVSAISIMDNTCKAQLNTSYGGRRIGRRYMQLADMTAGVKASLCGNFGQSLQLISDSILELSSVFKLNREPNPDTINVIVNGVKVDQGAINGWTYEQPTLTITFHGTAVPPSGATVQITFDPLAPKF
jgi:hypothetical protein